MSQNIGVRVVRRIASTISVEGQRQVCDNLPSLEREIRGDVDKAIKRKDYVSAAKHVNELVFLAQTQHELCARILGKVKRGRRSRVQPPFVAHSPH